MAPSREAYTCLPKNIQYTGNEDVDQMDSITLKYAVVKNDTASIDLAPWEERLFQTLVDAAIAYETDSLILNEDVTVELPRLNKPIEIRIAGGWVRDKIMKQESHDVDIALDSMSGHQFATIVQQYLIHHESYDAINGSDDSANKNSFKGKNGNGEKKKEPKIAVISANPNQSKHLETATMRVHNIDCDFVHLRGGEVYTSDSRIPTLKENATPLDDALRRDFTVNSLFYNLRTKQIEDWTGRGVNDLRDEKVLATPLDAMITFHDDPLRVLRAIRFAVRYDLALSEEIVLAAKSADVHNSLHVKVSRERVGKELEGVLSGKNSRPSVGLELITDLKLAGCVFEFPHDDSSNMIEGELEEGVAYNSLTKVEQKQARERTWLKSANLTKDTSPFLNAFKQMQKSPMAQNMTPVDERIFQLSTFLYPLRKVNVIDAKEKITPLPAYIIRDSIKFKNKDVKSITCLLANVDDMRDVFTTFSSISSDNFCRLRVGLLMRNLKDLWVSALLLAVIVDMHANESSQQEEVPGIDVAMNIDDTTNFETYVKKVNTFLQEIQRQGLDGCWKDRPLMDGKAILKSLGLPRGPIIGHYLQEQTKFMLLNPRGTKDDCETHLRAVRKRDLEIEAEEAKGKTKVEAESQGSNDVSMERNTKSANESSEPSLKRPNNNY